MLAAAVSPAKTGIHRVSAVALHWSQSPPPQERAGDRLQADRPAQDGGGSGPQRCRHGVAPRKAVEQHDEQSRPVGCQESQPLKVTGREVAGIPDERACRLIEVRTANLTFDHPVPSDREQIAEPLQIVGPCRGHRDLGRSQNRRDRGPRCGSHGVAADAGDRFEQPLLAAGGGW